MIANYSINLSNYDIFIVIIISFLTSIIVTLAHLLIKHRRRLYLELLNTNSVFFGKGKNGYLEKTKVFDEKTTYVESNFIFSIANNNCKPFIMRNIQICGKKKNKSKLEEGRLNINGTSKTLAGVISYDKLKHLVIKPYECIDYDVNIRFSREEYKSLKKIYLSYKGVKNKIYYIKIRMKKQSR